MSDVQPNPYEHSGSPELPKGQAPTSGLLPLGLLFGTMYFVQGIAEPTAGLIAQPVKSLLDSWGYAAGPIATFHFLVALPWSIKPLFGLLSDFVPIFGSRRKSYLVLCNVAAIVGLFVLYFTPWGPNSLGLFCLALLVPTVAVAFSDVAIDALMIEKGQPRGLTGKLQGIQWAAMYSATILTGWLGGWISQQNRQDLGFLICAAVTVPALVLSVFFVREQPAAPGQAFASALADLWRAAKSPALWGVAAFLFLWNFNPFSATVQQLHMTNYLKFSEQFYGNTISLTAVAAVAASVLYPFYCRRVPRPWLVHASIVLGIVSTLGYWWLRDKTSAVVITLAVGFTYMTAVLIQLDLAAQACPPRAAGTVFATLLAVSNLSFSLSDASGGWLYDWVAKEAGRGLAFDLLVGLGAALTALCWLFVPLLKRVQQKPDA